MPKEESRFNIRDFVRDIPVVNPEDIYDKISALGYIGQERSRRIISLSAYRHVKRLKQIHCDETKRADLTPRPNSILMGPTGCGKTYLLELLFGEILKIPYVIIDMTKFTESGYVGDDVLNILVQLVYASNENIDMAKCGVVVLDEFDKLAGSYSNARFAGQGTTKDVSGYGVQRELLKILEGTDIQIPLDFGFSNRGPRAMMSTRDISFFAIGAFSGIKDMLGKDGMGFIQNLTEGSDGKSDIAYNISDEQADDITQFHLFGFLPELIARFNRIIPFEPLDRNTLKDILLLKIENYQKEFAQEGFSLNLDSSLADMVVEESIKRQTGARGLDVLLSKYIENVAFEIFGKGLSGKVYIKSEGPGKVSHQIKKRA
ncbi:MAG: AAA domain-containing protein [Candidatus Dadabacteria bacterium]|nr:AAA domain-containing protein [Candidatus Dadabacteria bacterium]NIS09453.1 AAA domain-containing protein [Candidatus Dadabacteria bacterium]NIV42766.1 AAA domain-containing protein [Candidatus Dadabacteria bacterium]NIX15970.1 AAA domain-containing protein [Candidatus Dadabacteria bacterium]NIY22703.1 AAA domain-containing protein [Candidatus Dadabacteria bacterium]